MSSNGTIVFHVTVQPDTAGLTAVEMQHNYHLPDFVGHFSNYVCAVSTGNPTLLWNPLRDMFNAWHKFHLQLHSSFRTHYIMKSQVVQAYLHSQEHLLGAHDIVLINCGPSVMGSCLVLYPLCHSLRASTNITQVKAVFMPRLKPVLNTTDSPLLFVDLFTVVANPADDQEGVELYRVQCPHLTEDISCCVIIPMTDVVHPVELILVFETKIPGVEILSENCLDAYDQYYVNSFADKKTFNVILYVPHRIHVAFRPAVILIIEIQITIQ